MFPSWFTVSPGWPRRRRAKGESWNWLNVSHGIDIQITTVPMHPARSEPVVYRSKDRWVMILWKSWKRWQRIWHFVQYLTSDQTIYHSLSSGSNTSVHTLWRWHSTDLNYTSCEIDTVVEGRVVFYLMEGVAKGPGVTKAGKCSFPTIVRKLVAKWEKWNLASVTRYDVAFWLGARQTKSKFIL